MPLNNEIIHYINRHVSLNPEEEMQFSEAFQEVKVKKRQLIIQPNFVAKHRNFVLEGAFRSYVVAADGQESTIAFAVEDWWITDYNSYIYQNPATLFVVALENSRILQIDFETEQKLKAANHKFETFFRKIAEYGLAYQQRRIISNLTLNAEERYNAFLEKYPKIARRVPQYALASFLGMSSEFLSRIRNHKVDK